MIRFGYAAPILALSVLALSVLALSVLALSVLALTRPAAALDAAEKLSRECNKSYVKLCKGIKPGPEMIGRCAIKYPGIDTKVPEKCQADFQLNVEGYNDAKAQKR